MKLARIFTYLLIAVALVAALLFYGKIATYLISSIIFAYLLNPWVSWLERKHIPRIWSILIVYIIIGSIIAWGVTRVLPLLIAQAQNLISYFKASTTPNEITLLRVPFIQIILEKVDKLNAQMPVLNLHNSFMKILYGINKGLLNIPSVLLSKYQMILQAISVIGAIPIIGLFLLKDSHVFKQDLMSFVPNRYFEIVVLLVNKIDEIIGKYLRALFYEVLIVGTLSTIALTIIGVKYSILIGFMAGLANVIPYFGPLMGSLFAIFSVLIAGSPGVTILYVIIAMYLVQVIDNNFVYPIVIGTTINMHPMIAFLTVLAGGFAGGLVGMLVSVPLVYLTYSVLKVLYINLKEFEMF